MSVVGFDFGTKNLTIAVIRNRKLEIATNEVSMRYTPNVAGFTMKKRELGEAGKVQFLRNAQNSIYGSKLLLGRKFNDDDLKRHLPQLGACRWTELSNGDIGVTVNYNGKQTVLTAEQLAASMLTNMKSITEAFTDAPMSTCVVSVPGWWTHRQRRALMNACTIADVIPLRVVNDLSAVAFNYGFYHPGDFDEKSGKVMFVSMGHMGFECNVVEMSKLNCTIKATAHDLSLGGYLIDNLLTNYFADRFNKKYNCNIYENKRAMLKLLLATEGTKKTLNTNPLATISQDCLHEGYDLQDKITKDEYLELLAQHNVSERVVDCIKRCLESAKVDVNELISIEWVGSAMRTQVIRDTIQTFFGRPLSATMNAEEATAMGCAILCARLSPTASTRAYDLVELNSEPIVINWRSINDPQDTKQSSATLYPAGYSIPSAKVRTSTITRPSGKPFEIELKYGTSTPLGCETIGVAKVTDIPKRSDDQEAEVRVKFRADPSGTFSFVQADLIEEREETVEVPMEEEKDGENKEEKKDEMETEEKKPKTKTETRKVEVNTKVPLEIFYDELTATQVTEFKNVENQMRATEKAVIAALNAKNDLETFVYFVRDKIDGVWKEHATKKEIDTLDELLNNTSAWVYGDGDDVTKEEYDNKKKALTSITDKIAARYNEWNAVPTAISELQKSVQYFRSEVKSGDEKYSHIQQEELNKVLSQCDDAERVVNEKLGAHQKLAKDQDPVLYSVDLNMRRDNLVAACTKILNTPKPKPPPPAPKEEEAAAAADNMQEDKAEDKTQEQMETDVVD